MVQRMSDLLERPDLWLLAYSFAVIAGALAHMGVWTWRAVVQWWSEVLDGVGFEMR